MPRRAWTALVLVASLVAGCDSPLSIEQQVWCAANGDQVAAVREQWDAGELAIAVHASEWSGRSPTEDELACAMAYIEGHRTD
jgi:hypothetical protein